MCFAFPYTNQYENIHKDWVFCFMMYLSLKKNLRGAWGDKNVSSELVERNKN